MKSWNEIRKAATAFSKRWKNAYDVKSQAQSFLKEFFELFGLDTVTQATFEQGRILVEMKSKGKDLDAAFGRAGVPSPAAINSTTKVALGRDCGAERSPRPTKTIYDGDTAISVRHINGYLIDAPDVIVESRNAAPSLLRQCPKVCARIEAVRQMRLASKKEATRRKADTPSIYDEIRQPESGSYIVRRHNAQYAPITVKPYRGAHDRFLIVDSTVYHIGALLKDLGKSLFAYSKLVTSAATILTQLP